MYFKQISQGYILVPNRFLAPVQFVSAIPSLWHNWKIYALFVWFIQKAVQLYRVKLHPCSLEMLYSKAINLENSSQFQGAMGC